METLRYGKHNSKIEDVRLFFHQEPPSRCALYLSIFESANVLPVLLASLWSFVRFLFIPDVAAQGSFPLRRLPSLFHFHSSSTKRSGHCTFRYFASGLKKYPQPKGSTVHLSSHLSPSVKVQHTAGSSRPLH